MWTINFHFTAAVFHHFDITAWTFFSGLLFMLKTVDSLKNSCCIFVVSGNSICISMIFYFWLSIHKICSYVVLYFQTINSTMTTTFWQTHYHKWLKWWYKVYSNDAVSHTFIVDAFVHGLSGINSVSVLSDQTSYVTCMCNYVVFCVYLEVLYK